MRMLSSADIAGTLKWEPLIERLEKAFLEGFQCPPRHHHSIDRASGEATLLLMPAWQNEGYIGVKVVNVFPHNAEHSLPSISGLYLLSEGKHGTPIACMDGSELTRRRTAAASAVAARKLARTDASTLLVVGTGKLAPMVIEAHAAVRRIKRVLIWGRHADKAEQLAQEYAGRFETLAVTDLETACREADIISCVTLSTNPLILGEWLTPGTHIDLIGAFRPDMRETDAECVRRSEVFVDTRAGARAEAGDLIQAELEGKFAMDDVKAELSELLNGEHPGRTSPDAITLFKSVGASLEDLAAAIEVWECLTA